MKKTNKPTIEAIINTVALSLTASGVIQANSGKLNGYLLIAFGLATEYFKYWGRHKKLW